MGVGTTLQKFGLFLEECNEGLGTVHDVEFIGRMDSESGPAATLELSVPTATGGEQGGLVVDGVSLDADGRLEVTLESTAAVVPVVDHDVDIEPTAADIVDDGTVTASFRTSMGDGTSATASSEPAEDDSPASTADGAEGGKRDVPPFRDPELLGEVYESCETFAEMSDAIEMDVTAETVRRYMIDYGIHEPDQYDTGDAAATDDAVDPETEVTSPATSENDAELVVLTDGLGLPDDVTVESLVEAVATSNTIYEVTRAIDLNREETCDLLRRLDLLEFVVGRISEAERNVDRDEILTRLKESATAKPR
ncbi:hypothetical protein [Natrarchaeobaculum aegyptiacum]|uniref:Uncharacterized protein n=1 Tax=Natrarchaeobaculum aegyptiacum TaxID=745377 RepID=A0A2Z2I2N2_9EURY|nr:hypothetical protein [Natrarchaeobaculum aegyptiacum]ARS91208.1 hypothetical protein B1756_16725 [Natrarchaeobaculum aegyptiacum]